MKNCVGHKEATIESFVRDPKFAEAYLKDVMMDGDMAEIRVARSWVEEAQRRARSAVEA